MAYKLLNEYPSGSLFTYNNKKSIISKNNNDIYLGFEFKDVNITIDSKVSNTDLNIKEILQENRENLNVKNLSYSNVTTKLRTGVSCSFNSQKLTCSTSFYYTNYNYNIVSVGETSVSDTLNKIPYQANYLLPIENTISTFNKYSTESEPYNYTEPGSCYYRGTFCRHDDREKTVYNYKLNDLLDNNDNTILGTRNYTGYLKLKSDNNVYVDDETKVILDYDGGTINSLSVIEPLLMNKINNITINYQIRELPYNDKIGSFEIYISKNGQPYELYAQPLENKFSITPTSKDLTIQFKVRCRNQRNVWGEYFISPVYQVADFEYRNVWFNDGTMKEGEFYKVKTDTGWDGLVTTYLIKDKDNKTWKTRKL